jgi:solute:Na+ symporter, SSS family
MTVIADPAHAWGELIKLCALPIGLIGVLVAAEAAAYMSTVSSLLNWGGSFIVNDMLKGTVDQSSARRQISISRVMTLLLFVLSGVVAIAFVEGMISWFLFINSAMVVFLLPLAWLRFFWWRFNVWGELAAIVLGLPMSIIVWFVLGFENRPMWQGVGLLFAMSVVTLVIVTLLTPAEKLSTLQAFYSSCRPPGLWGPVRRSLGMTASEPLSGQVLDSILGIVACLGLVLATNSLFVANWPLMTGALAAAVIGGGWLIMRRRAASSPGSNSTPTAAPSNA